MSDYGHDPEFGAFITPAVQAPGRAVELAELADEVGLDLVSFQDHPYQARFLDAWTLLSFVAARTSRIHLALNVANLPLRPPAILARSMASLDLLSGGRAELGIGAGAFWDGVEAMGGRRLTPGQGVAALEEAIDLIRALWDTGRPGRATLEGGHYRLAGAARGPAPRHDIGVWVGAYKPRMLDLVGRRATGWLPSLPYLEPGDLARGNAAIDRAAAGAGRQPAEIRRLLNVSGSFAAGGRGLLAGPPDRWVEELTRMALEDGVSLFSLMTDEPVAIQTFAEEVAPGVRRAVEKARAGHLAAAGIGPGAARISPSPEVAAPAPAQREELGVTPTPDDGTRLSPTVPWDESTRPHRPAGHRPGGYTDRGRQVGRHLVDVHDMLRGELTELREVLMKVREGALRAGQARTALNEMALRQNDWAVGSFCARYCGIVTQHHGLEDDGIFPHLARTEPSLGPVIDRLREEHLVIHDAIQAVDRSLVDHINRPDDFAGIQAALDLLSDSLLSHLSYEEHELVEPLARLGFYAGQL